MKPRNIPQYQVNAVDDADLAPDQNISIHG